MVILMYRSEEAKETDRLKSKMEQAVFYGDRREVSFTSNDME